MSTLAPVDCRRLPAKRPLPWDREWCLAPNSRAPAMLRARNLPGEPLRASTYQYAPGMLLYRKALTGKTRRYRHAPIAYGSFSRLTYAKVGRLDFFCKQMYSRS